MGYLILMPNFFQKKEVNIARPPENRVPVLQSLVVNKSNTNTSDVDTIPHEKLRDWTEDVSEEGVRERGQSKIFAIFSRLGARSQQTGSNQ